VKKSEREASRENALLALLPDHGVDVLVEDADALGPREDDPRASGREDAPRDQATSMSTPFKCGR
jgi:hypothetical protein